MTQGTTILRSHEGNLKERDFSSLSSSVQGLYHPAWFLCVLCGLVSKMLSSERPWHFTVASYLRPQAAFSGAGCCFVDTRSYHILRFSVFGAPNARIKSQLARVDVWNVITAPKTKTSNIICISGNSQDKTLLFDCLDYSWRPREGMCNNRWNLLGQGPWQDLLQHPSVGQTRGHLRSAGVVFVSGIGQLNDRGGRKKPQKG